MDSDRLIAARERTPSGAPKAAKWRVLVRVPWYGSQMGDSVLRDAFNHHVWATLRLMDACAELESPQLEIVAPGTYGSILDTMRHIVGADCSYLYVISEHQHQQIDEDSADMAALRTEMVAHGVAWTAVLDADPDPDRLLVRNRDDGSSTTAAIGIRLAQAVHHGTDHRSQICTALTSLGVEPPFIDVWDYGLTVGRVTEVEPAT
jgi:uncharacterized damage-inducible protein DinB